jgi:hypothetical protein
MLVSSLSAQPLGTIPSQKASVSDQDYILMERILRESFANVARDNDQVRWSDYWNFAYAYTLAQQDQDLVASYLTKSRQLDPVLFDELIRRKQKTAARWRKYLGEDRYTAALTKASSGSVNSTQVDKLKNKETEYSSLEKMLLVIREDDQRYRKDGGELDPRQAELDRGNLQKIDSLYEEYGTYLGSDLVRKSLQHEMWAVIQHSTLKDMIRYLPVIRHATKCGQLGGEGPLKMLVDRICALKHSVQLFGSQGGVPIAEDPQLTELRNIYLPGITTSPRQINSVDNNETPAVPIKKKKQRFMGKTQR